MANREPSDATLGQWRDLGGEDPDPLLRTRLILHHAVQLLASFGQALIPARVDDSHRGMTWSESSRSFVSDATDDGLVAAVIVPTFSLEVRRGSGSLGSLDLHGRRPSQALAWLGNLLAGELEAGAGPMAWPGYDLPEQPEGADAPLEPDADVLLELSTWYGDAEHTLHDLFGDLEESSPVRCWPHHFDLATLLTYPAADAQGEAAYVGIGFSPGDDEIPAPYYYVNGSPSPAPEQLPELTGPGAWHTEGWVGAVLGAGDIVSSGSAEAQQQTVTTFLTAAVDAMRTTVLATR